MCIRDRCCHVLPALREGRMKRVLFLSTGALMSQTTFLQGESIPGIAHLIELSSELPEEDVYKRQAERRRFLSIIHKYIQKRNKPAVYPAFCRCV